MVFKHVVCFSGGHSSALVALEVAKRFPDDEVVLLNHNINPNVEHSDIKRFKKQVADYLGLEITYANYEGIERDCELPDQFDVAMNLGGFKFGNGTELCTNRLKTRPFQKWLDENCDREKTVIYYGFDSSEMHRVQRRIGILASDGWKSDYPLALWKERSYRSTSEVGIEPPLTYGAFKHANCIGCLKAGRQHWYVTYCLRPDLFVKAKRTEEELGYSIIKGVFLDELEVKFEEMKKSGIPATEHIKGATFWAKVKTSNLGLDLSEQQDGDYKPCECVF